MFAEMPAALAKKLEKSGFAMETWASEGGNRSSRTLQRLVAAFNTDPKDVDALIAAARKPA